MLRKRLIFMSILFFIIFSTNDVSVDAMPINTIDDLNQASSSISDISDHWAGKEIQEWTARGRINGYEDHSFKPDQTITRAEFISILDRALDLKMEADLGFIDMKNTEWYSASIKRAKYIGSITGYHDGTFRPEKNISRKEAATIVARLLRLKETENNRVLGEFTDSAPMTRAETVAMLSKALGVIVTEGIFGPDLGEQRINGNLTINNTGVKLQNLFIEGDLYCTAGIGDGSVYIENCIIKGRTIISGGGAHSVIFTNTASSELILYKTDGKVRIMARNDTSLPEITMETPAILEADDLTAGGFKNINIMTVNPGESIELDGNFESILINSPIDIRINGKTTVNNMYLAEEAVGTVLHLGKQVVVKDITVNAAARVIGGGILISASINADGVNIEQQVQNLRIAESVQTVIIDGKIVTHSVRGSGNGSNSKRNPVNEPLPAAPSAGFNNSPTSGDAPLTVTFTNTSTGTVDSLAWDFNGDGTTDNTTDNIANFTYIVPGTYNATLTVTNAGGSDTIGQTITVNELPPPAPSAGFIGSPTSGDAPLTVTFTNTSTGTVDSLAWDFDGDGTTDNTTDNTASFTYIVPGTYNATLTVTNAGGSNTISQTITVNEPLPPAPSAGFIGSPTSGDAPLTVTFTNTSTGTVDSLAWDFDGDGTTDNTTDNTASFTYVAPGTYIATLTVTNAGGSNTISQTITVNEP